MGDVMKCSEIANRLTLTNPTENEIGINPDEVEIIGSWVMVNGRMTEDDASHRISSFIKTELQRVATTKDGWEKLFRDPRDGRY